MWPLGLTNPRHYGWEILHYCIEFWIAINCYKAIESWLETYDQINRLRDSFYDELLAKVNCSSHSYQTWP